MSEFIKFSPC